MIPEHSHLNYCAYVPHTAPVNNNHHHSFVAVTPTQYPWKDVDVEIQLILGLAVEGSVTLTEQRTGGRSQMLKTKTGGKVPTFLPFFNNRWAWVRLHVCAPDDLWDHPLKETASFYFH